MKQIPVTGVYIDPDSGQVVSTHSMIHTFRRCPKQFQYKYVDRLKPKVLGRPLRFGSWMHELHDARAKGLDWKVVHKRNCQKYAKYFDEEKEMLGDLPNDCYRTMQAYIWHYKDDEDWTVLESEFTLEVEMPDGSVYRCRLDQLVENEFGLWIVDHKNHKKLPSLDFRILDSQSALYVWAALKNGIKVQGHIWNYTVSKPPSIPDMLKDGTRLSRAKCATDFTTLAKTIKANGLDPNDYAEWLRRLKAVRYRHGAPQGSPFFRREVLEKNNRMLKLVATAGFATHIRMNSYDWERVDAVERSVERSCEWMCNYIDLCTTELFGGNAEQVRRSQFTVGDPLDYYNDERERAA